MRTTVKFTAYFEAEIAEEEIIMDVYERSKAGNFEETKAHLLADLRKDEEYSKVELISFEVIEHDA